MYLPCACLSGIVVFLCTLCVYALGMQSHIDMCLWHSRKIAYAKYSHTGEGAKIIFSSPHERTLILLELL